MNEHPIIFSGEMVRAILEGKKTQTRRVVKPRGVTNDVAQWLHHMAKGVDMPCPYGVPGDQLWVRETWRIGAWRDDGRMAIDYAASPELTRTPWVTIPDDEDGEKFNKYWISLSDECERKDVPVDDDGDYIWEPGKAPLNWRPSIFMPKWASRIALEIVSVRVERLQEISRDDAFFEGISPIDPYEIEPGLPPGFPAAFPDFQNKDNFFTADPVRSFRSLWDSINAKRGFGWDVNPWIWVIEFKVKGG